MPEYMNDPRLRNGAMAIVEGARHDIDEETNEYD